MSKFNEINQPRVADHVFEFHRIYEHPISARPELQPEEYLKFREELIREEFQELIEARENKSLVGIADALGDLVYVIYGYAISCGIPLDEVIDEIHTSNMTKLWPDGTVHKREDGKVLKGPNYRPPNLGQILLWHERHYQLMFSFNTNGQMKKEAPISESLSEATERDRQTP